MSTSLEASSGTAPSVGPQAQRTPGRLLVVFSTAHGVGKTVVATQMAAELAQQRKRPVALLDLDPAHVGEVCRRLGLSPARSVADLLPELRQELRLFHASASTAEGLRAGAAESVFSRRLDTLPTPHPCGVHVVTAFSSRHHPGQLDATSLIALLRWLTSRYDEVLVDGGNGFSDALIATLDAADLVLLVTTADLLDVYHTKWALAMLERLGCPMERVKLVLNRMGPDDAAQMSRGSPCEVLGTIPLDEQLDAVHPGSAQPSVLNGSGEVARAVQHLVGQLLSRPALDRRAAASAHRTAPGVGQPAATQKARSAEPDSESLDEIVRLKRRIHARLVEENLDVQSAGLTPLFKQEEMAKLREKTERTIARLLERESSELTASAAVHAHLAKEIADEALGLGPLEDLLADAEISDILVNNKDQIYVERRGRLELTARRFVSDEEVRAVIERIVASLGRRIDESSPMVDARLPDGSRLNAIIPPLSVKGPVLSIRKFSRVRYSAEDLIAFGTLSDSMMQFLRASILARKNILISGGSGSGKTTLLNVLSGFIPDHERIITIEDAAELKLAQAHWVSLEARPSNIEGRGQVSIRDLFRNALRMRPDRILIGECRGGETLDMLQAMNTGHDGSLTTLHANSPRDVIARLDSLVLMSGIELPVRAIRDMVASAIHLILHAARFPDGTRKITSVSELVGTERKTEVVPRELFRYHQSGTGPDGRVTGTFVSTGEEPTFLQDLTVKGFALDPRLFAAGG